jgi:hypothetical protein
VDKLADSGRDQVEDNTENEKEPQKTLHLKEIRADIAERVTLLSSSDC